MCLAAFTFVSVDAVAVELTARENAVFGQICARCHARPDIGVPLIGDAAEWQRRGAAGFEQMVRNTIVGAGDMPPLGTCAFCTETEIRNLVQLLSGLSPEEAVTP